jgi:hypothetical protein
VISYEGSSGASHADRFWALSLALHAASNKVWLTMSPFPTEREVHRVQKQRTWQLQGVA